MNPTLAGGVLGAYLVGAIPFGVLVAKYLAGVDPREGGSGNIGATNVARTAGKRWGVLTLVLDASKGLGPVLAMQWGVVGRAPAPEAALWVSATAFAAFIGHCYPVYLRFKGGKGVATGLGVFLAIGWPAAAAGFAAFAAVYALFRVSSVGSLVAAFVVPTTLFLTEDATYGYLSLCIVAVVIWKHRGNIQRIVARTENKV